MTDSANLHLGRSIYAGWERGDFGSVEWADPEIEYVIADGPEPGGWSGLARTGGGNTRPTGGLGGLPCRGRKVPRAGGWRVLVFVRAFARGKTSGVEVENLNAKVLDINDVKVTRLISYNNRDRALACLGLEG